MRKILISTALISILSVVNGSASMENCQKNCASELSSCLATTLNMEKCLEKTGTCTVDCFNGLPDAAQVQVTHKKGKHHHHHHNDEEDVTVKGEMEVCQKNCGIDYGKCLIQTFDMNKCTRDEAACALDCLKGTPFVAKYDTPVVKKIHNVEGTMEVCQKNCAIDYGKCMIQTFDMATCSQQEACCALDCLKGVKVQGLDTVQSSTMEVCQQNCGIDYGKCLIQTFDMNQCTRDEASCALDCLKGVAV